MRVHAVSAALVGALLVNVGCRNATRGPGDGAQMREAEKTAANAVEGWGEPSAGLRCRLTAPKGRFTVPGEVILKLEVQNVSDSGIVLPYDPVVVATWMYNTVYTAPCCKLTVRKEGADPAAGTVFDTYLRPYAKSSVVGFGQPSLKSGETWSREIRFLVGVSAERHRTFPGQYSFAFVLGSSGAAGWWSGRAESNTLAIQIGRRDKEGVNR